MILFSPPGQVSCDKRPHSRSLATHWDDNYPALLALLGSVHTGVRGLTMDTEGNILAGVRISVRSEQGPTVHMVTVHCTGASRGRSGAMSGESSGW